MTKSLIIAGVIVALAAGCSAKAAPAQPGPPPDFDRAACHALGGITAQTAEAVTSLGTHSDLGPVAKPVAQLAVRAKNRKVADAGQYLLDAANKPRPTVPESQADPVLDIATGENLLMTACRELYGDGPW